MSQKKHFLPEDVEKIIQERDGYANIKGIYIISSNSIVLGPTKNGINFYSTEEDFKIFVDDILDKLNVLSPIPAESAPPEWVPLPGVNKEKVLSRYEHNPELYLTLIQEDPNILTIRKVDNEGKRISWIAPDGMIGRGAFPTS
jgi:hypothetical protein